MRHSRRFFLVKRKDLGRRRALGLSSRLQTKNGFKEAEGRRHQAEMNARYIERNGDISPLSRYVAMSPDAGGKAASPLEKIYSFFVRDLAEASARKRQSRPGNCLLLIRWVTGRKL
jgi:hypothetical protein